MAEQNQEMPASKLDYAIALVIGLATILGALAAYYASLWGGNCITNYNKGIIVMTESNTNYLDAQSDFSSYQLTDLKDDLMYAEWVRASNRGDIWDMEYFASKLTEPYQAYLYAETEEDMELVNQSFQNYEDSVYYTYTSTVEHSDSLYNEANRLFKEGQTFNSNGDAFTLLTVLFTLVLFFGGLASVANKNQMKRIYLIAMVIILTYASINMFMTPFP